MLFFCLWLGLELPSYGFAAATCYTANGLVAPNDEPCYPEAAKHSVCCPPGSICSASKLCILPNSGQAHRGSCTDRRWGRDCPHFCLSEHPGDDGLTGVNMTLCDTNPTSTSYCCNDWTGRKCNCQNKYIPKVTMTLLQPMATIPSKHYIGSTDNIEEAWSSSIYDIPWNTLGPILASIMGFCILGLLLYLARLAYLTKRRKDPNRHDSVVENGRRFSDFFWNSALDEKAARADSRFSIGTLGSDFDGGGPSTRKSEDQGKIGNEWKLSVKSIRFPIMRSKSTGTARDETSVSPLTPSSNLPPISRISSQQHQQQQHEPIIWRDVWNTKQERGSLPGVSTTVVAKLKERPGFKRLHTDVEIATPPEARKPLPRSQT